MSRRHKHPEQRARSVAQQVAFDAHQTQSGLQQVLNRALTRQDLSRTDKNLITELSYGYLRYKGRIDFILSRYFKTSPRTLPPRYLNALGLAVYEVLWMDSIPEYATLDVSVQMHKKWWGQQLAGLSNALLRKISRERDQLGHPEFYQEDHPGQTAFFSRYYSCPEHLVRILQYSHGPELTQGVLKRALHPPPVGIRINRTRPGATNLFAALRTRVADSLLDDDYPGLACRKIPQDLAAAETEGRLSRQSLAAQKVLHSLQPLEWPLPIWDACCGHGGKAGQLLECGIAPLWVSDRTPRKVRSCREELQRLHFSEVPALCADATRALPSKHPPGTILLDVPCSGLGVLSRRPDIKWKRSLHDVQQCLQIQQKMLRTCAENLGSGAQLVYLTCTLNHGENQGQLSDFLGISSLPFQLIQEYFTPFDSPLGEYFYAAVLRKD